MRTAFGIHNNEGIRFLSLDGAEHYLLEHCPEHIASKESAIEYVENMIWEDKIILCEGCDAQTLISDMDSDWVRGGCCDTWFCHPDCHG